MSNGAQRHRRMIQDMLAGEALSRARHVVLSAGRSHLLTSRSQTIYYLTSVECDLPVKSVARAAGTCPSQVRAGIVAIEDARDCARVDAVIATLTRGLGA